LKAVHNFTFKKMVTSSKQASTERGGDQSVPLSPEEPENMVDSNGNLPQNSRSSAQLKNSSSLGCSDTDTVSTQQDGPLWKARMKVGALVNHEKVQICIILAIMANALLMGIGTFDFVEDNPDVDMAISNIDKAFLIIFSIEAASQLFYLGHSLFSDGWLVFDLAIVVLSWSFESLQIVRAFRIFRAFRLITRVKPLRDLVLAIGAVLPRMYAIAALLLLVFYIFAVLFTELFSTLELEGGNYFGSLDASFFTCMEMMTLEWGEICRKLMEHIEWAWIPVLFFIAITGFIVFNLIVAVVCDAVAVTEKTVRKMDGYEEDDVEVKLLEAQERIDLLQSHINDMLKTQENVHILIEKMAQELVYFQTERMNAGQREAALQHELEERKKFEAQMDEKYLEQKRRRSELRQSSLHSSRHSTQYNLDESSSGDGVSSDESQSASASVKDRQKH
jgi:hypothetical protein